MATPFPNSLARDSLTRKRAFHRGCPFLLLLLLLMMMVAPAQAGTIRICRTFDIAAPLKSDLVVPANSLFRDNGRADDPLAAFNGERWQMRLVTIAPAVMRPLMQCVNVLARVTGDSSVKSVAAADNRTFVYAGSYDLLEQPETPESLFTLTARVMDQVP